MGLAIAVIVAYIPFIIWVIVEIINQQRPQKRIYEKTKTNDSWIR
jgi:hypothetical protein